MNAQTRFSSRGQVVIPKAVRERYGFEAGDAVDVVERTDGILLKPAGRAKGSTVEQAVARFRKLYTHVGPPATIEEMDAAVARQVVKRWTRRA